MSTLAWLPPLNSHPDADCKTYISIKQHKLPSPEEDDSPIDIQAFVAFVTKVTEACPISSTFCGLCWSGKFHHSFDSLSSSPSKIKEFISCVVSCLRLPVNLDRVTLRLRHLDELDNSSTNLDESADDWDVRIEEFLARMRSKSYNAGQKKLPFRLDIGKKILISDDEYKAWTTWYEDKKKADPNFERDYNRAISRLRTEGELWYEEALKCKAVSPSVIEKTLKDVCVDDSNASGGCVVCLEELKQGSKAVSLPCSHVFHRNCIEKWLHQTHECPLCRYMLPPVGNV